MPLSDNARSSLVRRLTLNALMLSLSLILSYIEAILPLNVWIPLPGFRLGLAQLVITLSYFTLGRRSAAAISATRVGLMGLLFGSATSTLFSLCGALLAYLGLVIGEAFLRRRVSYLGLGILCAALHNLGQLIAATMLFGTAVFWSYLPALLLAALIFGAVGGVVLNLALPRLSPIIARHSHKGGVRP